MIQNALLLQYVFGGLSALFVSVFIFTRASPKNKTWASKCFFTFGLLIVLWEFATFFQRTAPTPDVSAFFFYVVLISSSLSQPTYLITALSIQKDKKIFLLIFIPALIRIITFLFLDFTFAMTDYGWTFNLSFSGLPIELGTTIYLGYFFVITIVLFELIRKARSAILKKKYVILLVSFTLFQAIGFTLTNYLLTINNSFPPLGGVLQLLTFIAIGFALTLKETRIPSPSSNLKSFPEVYSSFLTDFYNSSIDTNLGEAAFKFTDFLKSSQIENKISIREDAISFEAEDDLNLLLLINKNLKSLEAEGDNRLIDSYLRVLKTANLQLGNRFDKVVIENMDFLKKSDLIYGISGGKYLKDIDEDRSLNGLNDVEACLKIYKRLLLAVSDKISPKEFQKRLALYRTTKTIKLTKYGEISIEATKKAILHFPKDQQLFSIIESFNPLTSWVYSKVLGDSSFVSVAALENLKQVLRLNRERAIRLRIYPTLLESLAAKIPKEEIEHLYHEYLKEEINHKSVELQKVRSRLCETERLSAIGSTTRMVGHDLRNPLQVIINTIHLARIKLEYIPPKIEKHELEDIYNKIESQVIYMDKIITDLQDFSRPITINPIKTNLKELVEDVLSTLSVPKNIDVSVNFSENTQSFRVDPHSSKRIFYNLILNAIQAMPDGGNLTISIHSTDENVIITVEDTGVGIPEKVRTKIFEPFYTTKAQGQGLGLSITKKFVEANGGSIEVESEEGKGTIFKVKLPIT
jgi:signal transduction histidine kinase